MSKTGLQEQLIADALGFPAEAIPERVRATCRVLIADCVGVILAGCEEPVSAIAREHAHNTGGVGEASVPGGVHRLPAGAAAFVLGTMAHALDLDDDEPSVFIGHLSATIVATLLPLAEKHALSGAQLLASFAVGVESEFSLGRLLNPSHYDAGHHATSSLGVLAATLAAARMLRLDKEQTGHAFGYAASHLIGIKRNFGTMTKPLHVGSAARIAAEAVTLAQLGVTSARDVLTGAGGVIDMYSAEDKGAPTESRTAFGAPWGLLDVGVAIKQYPSCSNTHPAIDAMRRILSRIDSGSVDTVSCYVAPATSKILQYPHPENGLEAKFSMEYCLAATITYNRPWIEHFRDAAVADPRIQALLPRISVTEDDSISDPSRGVNTSARVVVSTTNGATEVESVEHPRGSSVDPLSGDELRHKFELCTTRMEPTRARALFAALLTLDDQTSIAPLITLLTGANGGK